MKLLELAVCLKCCVATSCRITVARHCTMLNVTSSCVVTACSAGIDNGKSCNLEHPRGGRRRVNFLLGPYQQL